MRNELDIPGIRITGIAENSRSIEYGAEAEKDVDSCPHATNEEHGGYRLYKHTPYHRYIKDVKQGDKLVEIDLKIKRYRCSACGAILSDQFSFFGPYSHVTKRLEDELLLEILNGATPASLKRKYELDPTAIKKACKRAEERIAKERERMRTRSYAS